jgi:energy-converting hydrogenase Eha subunit C
MRLSAPKVLTWLIAVILGVLGIVGYLIQTAPLGTYSVWLLMAGFVLLVLATLFRDL